MGYYVYIHTCKDNGKKYVGITTKTKPEYRWGKNGEGYYQNEHFRSAILKYGWTNFEHEVFEVDSKEEMYRKEVELISFYHSNDPRYGYNHSSGGEKGALGCIRSEEYRKKISKSRKGKPFSEEHREHLAEAKKGKTQSEEHKRHIGEASKKNWADPEYRRKQVEVAKNRPRIKISLPDGTVLEMTKQNLTRNYINKGRKFEYVD